MSNKVILSGTVVKTYPIKYTLNGLPVISFILEHRSVQIEAGTNINIKCCVYCIIVDARKYLESKLDHDNIQVEGFLAYNSKLQLILHVEQLKIFE